MFALDTFEIRDEEINVEEIMQKIRENIKRRKENSAHQEEGQHILCQPEEQMSLCQPAEQVLDEKKSDLLKWSDEIRRDLDYINSNWDIQNNSYFISSHRPYSGKFLIKGRELVHGEVRRYVDPMIYKQREFNGSVARTLNEATKKISEISQIVTSARASVMVVSETTRRISEISQKTIELENEAAGRIRSEIGGKVDEQIGLVKAEIGDKVEEQVGLVRSEIGGKIDEQIGLMRSQIRGKVDEQIGLVRSEIGGKIDEQIGLVRSEICGKIDEKIGLVRAEIDGKVDEQIGLVRSEIGDKVDEKIGLVRAEINYEIATQVKAIVSAMNQEIESRAGLASILDRNIGNYQSMKTPAIEQEFGLNYFLFEEKFRGHRLDIKQRQVVFIPYFEACKNVVDIGCGRGEFLEIIKERGIIGKGIDIDEDMVSFCKSRGLDAEVIDAISYLEAIEDKSIDGIFIDQVIEHLDPDYLIKMIGLCYKKLIFGGILIAETVNPLSFASFANFYIDLSHKRPIHPETLRFILGFVGFREMEIKFLSPVPEDVRLRRIDVEHSNEKEKHLIENYNYNINTLNNILFGSQDYAVVVKK